MVWFWFIALCLAALTVVILLMPYLRGRAPGGHATPVGIALGAPVAAMALYFLVGTPAALDFRPSTGVNSSQHMAQATAALAQRMRRNPDDLQGWLLLGRARAAIGQPQKAVEALQQARRLAPDNPAVLVQLARAMGYARNYRLTGEPAALLARAVQLAPHNQRALWYAGIAEYQARDFKAAVNYWKRLLPLVDPAGDVARTVEQQIARARSQMGDANTVARHPPGPVAADSAAASRPSLQVAVRLAPELQSGVNPGDTVFIFARAVSGPPMPLAVERHRAADLPLTVVLDPSDSMTGAASIANAGQVEVVARISKSGNAIAQSGDMEGSSGAVLLPHSGLLEIVIDETL